MVSINRSNTHLSRAFELSELRAVKMLKKRKRQHSSRSVQTSRIVVIEQVRHCP